MPTPMGRSKLGPSFLTSAGARLMVVRPMGGLKPEFEIAVMTRSRDSFTAVSGKPTITMSVSPQPTLTSTSTGNAWMPWTAAEQTRANMGRMVRKEGRRRNSEKEVGMGATWARTISGTDALVRHRLAGAHACARRQAGALAGRRQAWRL